MFRFHRISFCLLIAFANKSFGLIMPMSGPTRHQIIIGVGIPVDYLDVESITWGLVAKAQFKMPESPAELKFSFFPDVWEDYEKNSAVDETFHRFPNGRRRREIFGESAESSSNIEMNGEGNGESPLVNDTKIRYDDDNRDKVTEDDEFDDQFEEDLWDKKTESKQHEVEEDLSKNDDFDSSTSRWIAYEALSSTLESKGFNGRTCVLRGICESADVQFSEHLMSELFHIFFTPSTTSEPVNKPSDYDFIKAEQLGRDKSGPGCEEIFHQCKRSIMEIFTEVYDSNLYQF